MNPHRYIQRFAPLMLLLATVTVGAAQEGELQSPSPTLRRDVEETPAYSGPNHSVAPTAQAVRTTGRIVVDGRLDEEEWQAAPAITNFTQLDPVEGDPVSQPTEVRFLYDDEAIYVGAWMWDDGEILQRLARRDAGIPDADFFVVIFDSFHDHRTAYRFATNPTGVKRDEIMTGGGGGGGGGPGQGGFGDASWDPVYDLQTSVSDNGWFVEYRIPFSQLRFSPAEELEWGLQVERKIRRHEENTVWAYTPKTEPGGIVRFGHLRGIRGIEPGRRLEILPYVGGRAEFIQPDQDGDVNFVDPFRTDSEFFGSLGADIKYRLTSNITLDATVNPDFGQVEVDPAVINLTAFETRYDEKRPFFVEGAEIFNFGAGGGGRGGGGQILYSRRIGREPQGEVPDVAVYEAAPSATTILGAAKVTGKTDSGWSVGLLNAVTNEEEALYSDATGLQRRLSVEPFTNYFVGRLRREFRIGQTAVGGMFTAVNRNLEEGSDLEGFIHSAAYSGGMDLRHAWDDRNWQIQAQFSPSYVTGSPEAIEETQTSSARYYQRPDADYLSVDPNATSLSGYLGRAAIEKMGGRWTARLIGTAISPGYEINDMGFLTTVDRLQADLNMGYEETRPSRYFRRWSVRGGPDFSWNYAGQLVDGETNVFGNGQFANYWGFGGRLAYNPPKFNDRLTRGGPLARDPAGYSGSLNISSDSRHPISGRAGVNIGWDDAGAWRRSGNIQLTMRPSSMVQVEIGPDLSRSHVAAQYVTTVTDPLANNTYGSRYVFAELDQTTLGIDTRVNVTFTPDLSFELYAQPFISSGDYGNLMELAAPRTFDFNEYGADVGTIAEGSDGYFTVDPDGSGAANSFRVSNRDFNLRSLRGNAVFRWEWNPGSTLFVVWQQNRVGRESVLDPSSPFVRVGNFDFGRDVRELAGLTADNVLLIKFSYWLNP